MIDTVTMAHGSGGYSTNQLINDIFLKYFSNDLLDAMADSAVIQINSPKIAFTTDSYVVRPMQFPGGDIGRLAVCGTVNDLLCSGATPLYLSAGFILEEGLQFSDLDTVCASMKAAAEEAGVIIAAGDTKVVEGSGGIFINTSGIGEMTHKESLFSNAQKDDVLIITGNLGDHHACILSQRMGIDNHINSDTAPLTDIISSLQKAGITLHGIRDITRGGLGTVLCEISNLTRLAPAINEQAIPISDEVLALSGILGLEIMHMGNEGNMLIIVPKDESDRAVRIIKDAKHGEHAAIIGSLKEGSCPVMLTKLGAAKNILPLMGEGLPRIC